MGFFDFFKKTTNADGQPLVQAFRSEAIVDRQIDELIGLIKGVMADGIVHQGEVEFLIKWMETNRLVLDKWPTKAIYPRLIAAMADGNISLDEEREIMNTLLATVGGNTAPLHGETSNSTSLPYTQPFPALTFEGTTFCFTGKFHSGTRQWCENQISARGGIPANGVTKKLNYLVIGEIGSRDWLHSTFGRKIEKAIEHNEQGGNIAIVGEQHWFEQVNLR